MDRRIASANKNHHPGHQEMKSSFLRFILKVLLLGMGAACLVMPMEGWASPGQAGAAPAHDPVEGNNPRAMPFAPPDDAVVHQTPPDFSWPLQQGNPGYRFRLIPDGGKEQEIAVSNNWLNWTKPLAPGEYSWQVGTVVTGKTTTWSRRRRFTVAEDAVAFIVTSADVL